LRAGQLGCSAVLGTLATPFASATPDVITIDGMYVYAATPLLLDRSSRAAVIELADANVVLNPNVYGELGQPLMHFEIAIGNPAIGQAVRVFGEGSALPRPTMFAGGGARIGDTLFHASCTSDKMLCATTSAAMADVRSVELRPLVAYGTLGAIAGASLGVSGLLYWRRNQSVPRQLRRAIRNDALTLVYQPLVELDTRRIVGAEALVRWTDQSGNAIPPDVFVGIAEAGGFVSDITRLAIRKSLAELGALLLERPDFHLSINIAPDDLADPEFFPHLRAALAAAGVPPRSLTIELTERSTADRAIALAGIARLRTDGHQVDIDDFGTGYSSLSYLNELEVDAIKIDRAFTMTVGTEAVTASIVPQILAMAATLDLGVVVEGIETEAQAAYFAATGRPVLGQGWLFSKPLPAAALIARLKSG
jgi:sensor c-di-GMP phosphodiesterase-like protein